MKKNKQKYISFFIIGISILLLSSCSESALDEPVQENNPTTVVNHEIDPTPLNLSSEDLILSLKGYGAVGALQDEELSIVDMLWYAVEDEYLALNDYLSIMEIFGEQKPYTNISNSERSHLSFLEEVYLSYNLDFPDDTASEHVIIPTSLLEAAETGVQAEIDNIMMYDKFLAYELPENVEQVFLALKAGSESHLLAFEKQVNRLK